MKNTTLSSILKNVLKYVTLILAFAISIYNHQDTGFSRFTHLELQGAEACLTILFVATFLWVTVTTYKEQQLWVKIFLALGMLSVTFFMIPTTGQEKMFFARIVIYSFTIMVFMFLDLVILLNRIPKKEKMTRVPAMQ